MIDADDCNASIYLVGDALDDLSRRAMLGRATSIDWHVSASRQGAAPTRSIGTLDLALDRLDDGFAGVFPHRIGDAAYAGLSVDRVVVARYVAGDRFDVHTDAPWARDERTCSFFSVLLYLNDDFTGGETFFPELRRTIRPRAGTALVFGHRHRHCGCPVIAGTKFVLHLFAIYSFSDANGLPISDIVREMTRTGRHYAEA